MMKFDNVNSTKTKLRGQNNRGKRQKIWCYFPEKIEVKINTTKIRRKMRKEEAR